MSGVDRKHGRAPFDTPGHRKLRGPNGRRLCKMCGQEVPKGRQTWCGDDCVRAHETTSGGRRAILALIARDGGICARCGEAEIVETERWLRLYWRDLHWGVKHAWPGAQAAIDAIRQTFHDAGYSLPKDRWTQWRSLAEADHTVPLIEGGPNTPANMRLLCQPCHRQVTRELRARLAKAKRDARTNQNT